MVREWITPIYDRTYGDVQAVQYNPDEENAKGCWNAVDLNRIEKNTAYVKEWMLEQKIYRVDPGMRIEENDYWKANTIPHNDEIRRVINNVAQLIERSKDNPAIADQLPTIYAATQINYQLANDIERALDIMHNQPKLPLDYWKLELEHGIIKSIQRADGTTETIMASEALIAEDEIASIYGQPYGDDAQYQIFQYWSGNENDLQYIRPNYETQDATYIGQYRDVKFTANFITKIPRTLSLTNGYISVTGSDKAESGPRTGTYFAGDDILIIADIAPYGKAFYEWLGTQEGLDNLTGASETDPSTCWLTMPDCDVSLSSKYVSANGQRVIVNNGSGGGVYKYKQTVSISANVPNHYGFDNWSGNTNYLSDRYSQYQSFTMPDEPLTFTANYSYKPSYNSVQIINGLIDGQTQVNGYEKSTLQLTPTPPDSSQGLQYWQIEGLGSVSGNTFTIGDGNAIITGHYNYIRTLTVNNRNNSGTTSTYTAVQGNNFTKITTGRSYGNYKFNGWYENDSRISTSTEITITAGNVDRTIEARYDYYPTYTVTVKNQNDGNGSWTRDVISGEYFETSTNEESTNGIFTGWSGDRSSSSRWIGFTVTGNITITANYRERETYHLTVNNGSGSGDYKELQWVNIVANSPDEGASFTGWSQSGLRNISNSNTSSTSVQMGRSNATVTANYSNIRQIRVITNTSDITYNVVQGKSINIASGSAPDTWEFHDWGLTSGDASIGNTLWPSTTITANNNDSVITCNYTPIPWFTVTMVDGYIQNSNGEWVTSATLLRNSYNNIKMKPAPTGQQFLQWEVYENGVLQTNADDVYEPFAETTRLRNLLRNITIKATYYTPDPEVKYTLTIHRKDGTHEQSEHPVGDQFQVNASYPDEGMKFLMWENDFQYLMYSKYIAENMVRMPAANIELTERYVSKDYVTKYHLYMQSNGECKYQTSYTDPETGETTVTDHWVTDWEYEEGEQIDIRTKAIPFGWKFTGWSAVDDNNNDYNVVFTSTGEEITTLFMPGTDIYVTAGIVETEKYRMDIVDGGTSGSYYQNAKVDIYFNKQNTDDIQYVFTRWTGDKVYSLELYDGGMFNVLTPTLQYIKMPKDNISIRANYNTKYRFYITNGTIDSQEQFFLPNTTLNITANPAPEGMKFQRWDGNTEQIANKWDPTTTITTVQGITRIFPVYSTNANQNNIGYVLTDISNNDIINIEDITIISGEVDRGFIITDIKGHIYMATSTTDTTANIMKMTKTYKGGEVYE